MTEKPTDPAIDDADYLEFSDAMDAFFDEIGYPKDDDCEFIRRKKFRDNGDSIRQGGEQFRNEIDQAIKACSPTPR